MESEEKINKVLIRAIKESGAAVNTFDIQMRKLQDFALKAAEAGKSLRCELDKLVKEMEKEKANADTNSFSMV